MLLDELRARHDALNHQGAENEGHHGVAGNAQAHRRNEIALHRGMRRRLRAGDAFDHAGAEFLGCFRDLLLGRVGDEGGDRRTGSRNQRTQAADDGPAQHRRDRAAEFVARRAQVADPDIGVAGVDVGILVHAFHELGQAEQSERKSDQLDAVEQAVDAEGEARRSGLDVRADDAEQQAHQCHRDSLERRTARQCRPRQQAEQHQRADFSRAELQCDPHQHRRKEDHLGDAPGAPTNEEITVMPSAAPPRPCFVSGNPSRQVTAWGGWQGRLSRIEQIAPPYCAP